MNITQKELIRAVEIGDLGFIKEYFNNNHNNKDTYKNISVEILRSIYHDRKDVCEYLLSLDIMYDVQVDKYYHLTDLGYNLKQAISYCESTHKDGFLKMLIDQHNRNNI